MSRSTPLPRSAGGVSSVIAMLLLLSCATLVFSLLLVLTTAVSFASAQSSQSVSVSGSTFTWQNIQNTFSQYTLTGALTPPFGSAPCRLTIQNIKVKRLEMTTTIGANCHVTLINVQAPSGIKITGSFEKFTTLLLDNVQAGEGDPNQTPLKIEPSPNNYISNLTVANSVFRRETTTGKETYFPVATDKQCGSYIGYLFAACIGIPKELPGTYCVSPSSPSNTVPTHIFKNVRFTSTGWNEATLAPGGLLYAKKTTTGFKTPPCWNFVFEDSSVLVTGPATNYVSGVTKNYMYGLLHDSFPPQQSIIRRNNVTMSFYRGKYVFAFSFRFRSQNAPTINTASFPYTLDFSNNFIWVELRWFSASGAYSASLNSRAFDFYEDTSVSSLDYKSMNFHDNHFLMHQCTSSAAIYFYRREANFEGITITRNKFNLTAAKGEYNAAVRIEPKGTKRMEISHNDINLYSHGNKSICLLFTKLTDVNEVLIVNNNIMTDGVGWTIYTLQGIYVQGVELKTKTVGAAIRVLDNVFDMRGTVQEKNPINLQMGSSGTAPAKLVELRNNVLLCHKRQRSTYYGTGIARGLYISMNITELIIYNTTLYVNSNETRAPFLYGVSIASYSKIPTELGSVVIEKFNITCDHEVAQWYTRSLFLYGRQDTNAPLYIKSLVWRNNNLRVHNIKSGNRYFKCINAYINSYGFKYHAGVELNVGYFEVSNNVASYEGLVENCTLQLVMFDGIAIQSFNMTNNKFVSHNTHYNTSMEVFAVHDGMKKSNLAISNNVVESYGASHVSGFVFSLIRAPPDPTPAPPYNPWTPPPPPPVVPLPSRGNEVMLKNNVFKFTGVRNCTSLFQVNPSMEMSALTILSNNIVVEAATESPAASSAAHHDPVLLELFEDGYWARAFLTTPGDWLLANVLISGNTFAFKGQYFFKDVSFWSERVPEEAADQYAGGGQSSPSSSSSSAGIGKHTGSFSITGNTIEGPFVTVFEFGPSKFEGTCSITNNQVTLTEHFIPSSSSSSPQIERRSLVHVVSKEAEFHSTVLVDQNTVTNNVKKQVTAALAYQHMSFDAASSVKVGAGTSFAVRRNILLPSSSSSSSSSPVAALDSFTILSVDSGATFADASSSSQQQSQTNDFLFDISSHTIDGIAPLRNLSVAWFGFGKLFNASSRKIRVADNNIEISTPSTAAGGDGTPAISSFSAFIAAISAATPVLLDNNVLSMTAPSSSATTSGLLNARLSALCVSCTDDLIFMRTSISSSSSSQSTSGTFEFLELKNNEVLSPVGDDKHTLSLLQFPPPAKQTSSLFSNHRLVLTLNKNLVRAPSSSTSFTFVSSIAGGETQISNTAGFGSLLEMNLGTPCNYFQQQLKSGMSAKTMLLPTIFEKAFPDGKVVPHGGCRSETEVVEPPGLQTHSQTKEEDGSSSSSSSSDGGSSGGSTTSEAPSNQSGATTTGSSPQVTTTTGGQDATTATSAANNNNTSHKNVTKSQTALDIAPEVPSATTGFGSTTPAPTTRKPRTPTRTRTKTRTEVPPPQPIGLSAEAAARQQAAATNVNFAAAAIASPVASFVAARGLSVFVMIECPKDRGDAVDMMLGVVMKPSFAIGAFVGFVAATYIISIIFGFIYERDRRKKVEAEEQMNFEREVRLQRRQRRQQRQQQHQQHDNDDDDDDDDAPIGECPPVHHSRSYLEGALARAPYPAVIAKLLSLVIPFWSIAAGLMIGTGDGGKIALGILPLVFVIAVCVYVAYRIHKMLFSKNGPRVVRSVVHRGPGSGECAGKLATAFLSPLGRYVIVGWYYWQAPRVKNAEELIAANAVEGANQAYKSKFSVSSSLGRRKSSSSGSGTTEALQQAQAALLSLENADEQTRQRIEEEIADRQRCADLLIRCRGLLVKWWGPENEHEDEDLEREARLDLGQTLVKDGSSSSGSGNSGESSPSPSSSPSKKKTFSLFGSSNGGGKRRSVGSSSLMTHNGEPPPDGDDNRNTPLYSTTSTCLGRPDFKTRYFTVRKHVCPHFVLISGIVATIVGVCQGLALAAPSPEHCHAAMITVAVINVLSFFFSWFLCPFIVPFKNVVLVLTELCIAIGSLVAATLVAGGGHPELAAPVQLMCSLGATVGGGVLMLLTATKFFCLRIFRIHIVPRVEIFRRAREELRELSLIPGASSSSSSSSPSRNNTNGDEASSSAIADKMKSPPALTASTPTLSGASLATTVERSISGSGSFGSNFNDNQQQQQKQQRRRSSIVIGGGSSSRPTSPMLPLPAASFSSPTAQGGGPPSSSGRRKSLDVTSSGSNLLLSPRQAFSPTSPSSSQKQKKNVSIHDMMTAKPLHNRSQSKTQHSSSNGAGGRSPTNNFRSVGFNDDDDDDDLTDALPLLKRAGTTGSLKALRNNSLTPAATTTPKQSLSSFAFDDDDDLPSPGLKRSHSSGLLKGKMPSSRSHNK